MIDFKKIKLVVCDIDGTMVGASRFPTPQTVETIEKLMDRGYLFGVASGRPLDDLMDYCNRWNLKRNFDFIIAWNGCELYDSHEGKRECFNVLSKEELKEIVTFMNRFDVNTHMYKPGIYLSSKETDRAWFSAFKNKRTFVVANDLSDFYNEECCGIMFRTNPKDMPAIEEEVGKIRRKGYFGAKTQPDLMEFSKNGSNKSVALKLYCQKKGIVLDECIAFGDTSNDNEMLACCHGVCLLNGSDDTKVCAEIITDKTVEENGWVEFVEKNLL